MYIYSFFFYLSFLYFFLFCFLFALDSRHTHACQPIKEAHEDNGYVAFLLFVRLFCLLRYHNLSTLQFLLLVLFNSYSRGIQFKVTVNSDPFGNYIISNSILTLFIYYDQVDP